MKFLEYFLANQISIWKDFYWNYSLLKKILSPIYNLYKKTLKEAYLGSQTDHRNDANKNEIINNSDKIIKSKFIHLLTEAEKEEIIRTRDIFNHQLFLEIAKFEFFYTETWTKRIQPRWSEIQSQLELSKTHNTFLYYSNTFEIAIKEIYKEVNLLKDFIELNWKSKGKIIKKFTKVIKIFTVNKVNLNNDVDIYIKKSAWNTYQQDWNNIIFRINKWFSFGYIDKYIGKKKPEKVLKEYVKPNQNYSQIDFFYLGLGLGFAIFWCLVIYWLFLNYGLHLDFDSEWYILSPIYISLVLFIDYFIWFGIMIHILRKHNVHYKMILSISAETNIDEFIILKQCTFFLLIVLICIVCYFGSRFGFFISINYIIYSIICWGAIWTYYLLPIPGIFNYKGELLLFRLIIDSLTFTVDFRNIWFIEQWTSLVGPLRGMEYTVCYYMYWIIQDRRTVVEYCGYSSKQIKYWIITMIPFMIRIVQSIMWWNRQSNNNNNNNNNNNKSAQIINIWKYSLTLSVILLSFFTFLFYTSTLFFITWGCWVVLNALVWFFYDIKYDFGFGFNWDCLFRLRKRLLFSKTSFYYTGIILSLFLRVLFVVQLSPEILSYWMEGKIQRLLWILYFWELVRRFIWNTLKFELKHFEVSKSHLLNTDVKLPYLHVNEDGYQLWNDNNPNKEHNTIIDTINYNSPRSAYFSTVDYDIERLDDISEDNEPGKTKNWYQNSWTQYLQNQYLSNTLANTSTQSTITEFVKKFDFD